MAQTMISLAIQAIDQPNGSLSLRSHAHSNERAVGGAGRDPAGGRNFGEECRRFPGYTAIGGYQHLVHVATRLTRLQNAVHPDDARLRRRPRWALGPGRSRRSHRPRRALRAGRSRWPRRPRRTGFPLGPGGPWPQLATQINIATMET